LIRTPGFSTRENLFATPRFDLVLLSIFAALDPGSSRRLWRHVDGRCPGAAENIIPCGGFGHPTNVVVLTDQFSLRVRRTGGTRAVELLELLVGAHNDRQFFLDGQQLLAWDREVGVIVRGAGIDAIADAAEAGRRAR
jgi:hypothetical protein